MTTFWDLIYGGTTFPTAATPAWTVAEAAKVGRLSNRE